MSEKPKVSNKKIVPAESVKDYKAEAKFIKSDEGARHRGKVNAIISARTKMKVKSIKKDAKNVHLKVGDIVHTRISNISVLESKGVELENV